jgi:hypothetical protein
MTMSIEAATNLLHELERPGVDRLAVIDERIIQFQAVADFLKALRTLVGGDVLSGKPKAALDSPGRAARSPSPALSKSSSSPSSSSKTSLGRSSNQEFKRRLIGQAIQKNGPIRMTDAIVAAQCPRGSVTRYLNSAWFQKTPEGKYDLTSFGREQMAKPQSSH